MIPYDVVKKIVQRMTADTGPKGFQAMCDKVGVPYHGVEKMLTRLFGPPDGKPLCPSQLAMDMMMLGAAIGYLFGKGETVNEIRPTESDIAN